MSIIVDLIIIAILAICIFFGYKKGLTKCIIKIASFFIAIIVAVMFYKPVSDIVIEKTSIDESIESSIVNIIKDDVQEDGKVQEDSNLPNTILIPHLGASTEESEDNCAIMAVKEIADFLENGNIKNSVNYPAVDLGKADGKRLCLCYKGISDVTVLTDLLKANNIAVMNMAANTKGDFGYALFDIEGDANIDNLAKEGILKARII